MEKRITPKTECRVETRDDGSKVLVGYGAVFYNADDPGTEYKLSKFMRERISRGAFDGVLSRPDDVRGLFNHDPDHVLGRTGPETMRLSVDDVGLKYEIDLPDTQLASDLAASVERGDISGSSFSFRVERANWTEEDDVDIRNIELVNPVFDVGPVTFPAYKATSTALRSEGDDADALAERDVWKKAAESERRHRFAKRARARALDVADQLG